MWARSGNELFYLDPFNVMTAVAVEPGASAFTPGVAVKVLDKSYASSIPTYIGRQYDVANDGKRFLVMKDAGISAEAEAPSITIVQNRFEELRRR